jgi:hypothetical protein
MSYHTHRTNIIVNSLTEHNQTTEKMCKNFVDSNIDLSHNSVITHNALETYRKEILLLMVRSTAVFSKTIGVISAHEIFNLFSQNMVPRDYGNLYGGIQACCPNDASNFNNRYVPWDKLLGITSWKYDLNKYHTSLNTKIFNESDKVLTKILNSFDQHEKSILTELQETIMLTKLIQFNIKLKEELIDGLQNTHVYNYILRKMSTFANLIDFGYHYKMSKENIFTTTYISLNQIYDLFMVNNEEDYKYIKKSISENSIYLDINYVDCNQHIFSWDQLSMIIDKNTYIDCVSEKKYMKYLHKMYTEYILEILEEINA